MVLGIIVLYEQNTFEEVEFKENGTTSDKLNVSIIVLYPEKSADYSAAFKSTVTQEYSISISFYPDNDDSVELAKYLNATMEINGEEIAGSTPLSDYLAGKNVVYTTLPMTSDHTAIFTLHCTMPESVGNEAQNLTADFTMEITATPTDEITSSTDTAEGTGCASTTTNGGDGTFIGLTLGSLGIALVARAKRRGKLGA
jgi:hypothetical protein